MGDNYVAVNNNGKIQHIHQEQPLYKRIGKICEYYTNNIKYVALYKVITYTMFIFQIIFLRKFIAYESAVKQNKDKQLLFLSTCDCFSNTSINETIGDLYHDAYSFYPLSGVVAGVIMKTIVFVINFIVDLVIFCKLDSMSISMSTQWTLPRDCSKSVLFRIVTLFFSVMSIVYTLASSFPGNYKATYEYSTSQMNMHIVRGSVWYYDCQDGYVPVACQGTFPQCDETCSVLADRVASTMSIYCVNMTHVDEYSYSAYRTVIDSVNFAIFSTPSINISTLCDIIRDLFDFFISCFCHCS